MLALTTKPEPRNLWIALAFFGLSTMTRAWSPAAAPSPRGAAEARRRVGLVAAAAAVAVRVLGVVVFLAAGASGDLADFRATVTSYPAGTPGLGHGGREGTPMGSRP